MKKRLIAAQKAEMEEKFIELKPILFRWASYYAFWNKGFEINELVNVAFANGNLRRIKNPKFLSQKVIWVMKDYIRKVRRDNSVDRLVQMYVKIYGRQSFDGENNT